jgi:hypothetical protein
MSIEFVRAIYNTKEPLPKDKNFYHKALNDIYHDGIESQVYFLLKQQEMLEQTPPFFRAWLKERYEKGLYQNLFIKNQTDQILRAFEDLGIDVIPLKGVYFAKEFFGDIGARITSDIDLLIRNRDLKKVIQLIHTLGFTVEEEQISGHFHCSFSKPIPYSQFPLVVEIHWSIVKENTSRFNIDDFWAQAKSVAGSSHILELSPNHTFYMIVLHGWRHNLDSMKYFIDIIQVLHKYSLKIDYQEIFTLAASHQTRKRMARTLSIVYQEFPHLNDLKELSIKKKKSLWKYRPVKGLKLYADFFDYQFLSFDSVRHSLIEITQWGHEITTKFTSKRKLLK